MLNKASAKAYVSKNYLEKYKQAKLELLQQNNQLSSIQEESSVAVDKSDINTDKNILKEEIKDQFDMMQPKQINQIEADLDYDSAEEVEESDLLGIYKPNEQIQDQIGDVKKHNDGIPTGFSHDNKDAEMSENIDECDLPSHQFSFGGPNLFGQQNVLPSSSMQQQQQQQPGLFGGLGMVNSINQNQMSFSTSNNPFSSNDVQRNLPQPPNLGMFSNQQQQPSFSNFMPQQNQPQYSNSLFGNPSGSLFGAQNPQQLPTSLFGGGSSGFGGPSLFGQQQQQQPINNFSGFGNPQKQSDAKSSSTNFYEKRVGEYQKAENHQQQHSNLGNRSVFQPVSEQSAQIQNQSRIIQASAQNSSYQPKYKQEVDTNVYQLNLRALKQLGEVATGDPIFCDSCKAVLNSHSKVEGQAGSQQTWKCEFCNSTNATNLEDEELPKNEAMSYILEAASQLQNKGQQQNDLSIIFCLDISGSMCVSKPIVGQHNLKGDKTQGFKSNLMQFSDGSDQRLDGDRGVTYVSRMQCVQSAVEAQLNQMQKQNPNNKVGIVTFNNEVLVLGDAQKDPQVIVGDKLNDKAWLLANGITCGEQRLQKPVKDTHEMLIKTLMSQEETGPTALGPALLTSVAMASSSGKPGSQVILCTDGLSNIGLGSFDGIFDEEESKQVDQFYTDIGQFAKEKGITVNIISIQGEECNIDTLSKIAELTGGSVQRVDPIQLTKNFMNMMQQPVIATNVNLKVKLHKAMEFRNEDIQQLSEDRTILMRDLGNVTEDTEITFEYRLKPIKELIRMSDIDLEQVKEVPFQAQITYMDLNGNKCMRIVTSMQEVSNDKQELKANADFMILGQNAVQQTSKLARGGNLFQAQANAEIWGRQLQSNVQNESQQRCVNSYMQNMQPVYGMIQNRNINQKVSQIQEQYQPLSFGAMNQISQPMDFSAGPSFNQAQQQQQMFQPQLLMQQQQQMPPPNQSSSSSFSNFSYGQQQKPMTQQMQQPQQYQFQQQQQRFDDDMSSALYNAQRINTVALYEPVSEQKPPHDNQNDKK